MSYVCDSQDGQAAVLLISDLTDGSTIALCGNCVPGYVYSMFTSFAEAGIYGDPDTGEDTPPAEGPGGEAADEGDGGSLGSAAADPAQRPDEHDDQDDGGPHPADPGPAVTSGAGGQDAPTF